MQTVKTLAAKYWPAIAAVFGAVYFYSQGNAEQALTVLVSGFGLSQVNHGVSSVKSSLVSK